MFGFLSKIMGTQRKERMRVESALQRYDEKVSRFPVQNFKPEIPDLTNDEVVMHTSQLKTPAAVHLRPKHDDTATPYFARDNHITEPESP